MAAITESHLWGWNKEKEFKPILQSIVGEEIVQTLDRFDTADFESEHFFLELKSRRKYSPQNKYVDSTTYPDWLIPVAKIAKADEKETWFFYHFEGDNTLWRILYDPIVFKSFKKAPSPSNPSLHFYIPKDKWEQLF